MGNRSQLYGGIVWIFSASALALYAILGLVGLNILGVEELVAFAEQSIGFYIVLAAFITIFIEGLYFVGSFFPGSTLVVILAVLAQVVSLPIFLATAAAIYIGWCLAGAVNIFGAYWYRSWFQQIATDETYQVEGKAWATWFPPFRANYEVAQVIEGGDPVEVFASGLQVRLISGIMTTLLVITIPFVLDINTIDNEEGFQSLFIVTLIMLSVGFWKIYKIRRGVG